MRNIPFTLFFLAIVLCFGTDLYAQNTLFRQNLDSIGSKEAILILPGLGDSKKRRMEQISEFSNQGYDVFIPDYMDKDAYVNCLPNLEKYFLENRLTEYKKLHCFVYIIGGWTLNGYINKHGFQNVASIVYDRSPPQERAPYVVRTKLSLIGKLLKGKIVNQFDSIAYVPVDNLVSVNIGIIIENKPTSLIRLFKKTALEKGPILVDVESLGQSHDDYIYVMLDHNEMYYRFEALGKSIVTFFNQGSFPSEDMRKPFTLNIFQKQ